MKKLYVYSALLLASATTCLFTFVAYDSLNNIKRNIDEAYAILVSNRKNYVKNIFQVDTSELNENIRVWNQMLEKVKTYVDTKVTKAKENRFIKISPDNIKLLEKTQQDVKRLSENLIAFINKLRKTPLAYIRDTKKRNALIDAFNKGRQKEFSDLRADLNDKAFDLKSTEEIKKVYSYLLLTLQDIGKVLGDLNKVAAGK